MSRYNTIISNDIVNGEGVCVSFWVQGCPHMCEDCFNPETWNFNEGQSYTDHTKWEIIELISKNGIERNFSVLGGEPLAHQNLPMTAEVVHAVRNAYPNIKIFLWTGYTFNQLMEGNNSYVNQILEDIDVLIDGPYKKNLRDLSLKLRGSANQRIRRKTELGWKIDEY